MDIQRVRRSPVTPHLVHRHLCRQEVRRGDQPGPARLQQRWELDPAVPAEHGKGAVGPGNRTVDVHLVPSGGTAAVGNAIVYNVVVDATSTTFVNLSAVMAAGDFLAAKAQVASAVTMHSFGIQEA